MGCGASDEKPKTGDEGNKGAGASEEVKVQGEGEQNAAAPAEEANKPPETYWDKDVHRFCISDGADHFYSADENEIPHVQGAKEGISFKVSSVPNGGLVPVYRYLRKDANDHIYSADHENECGGLTEAGTENEQFKCEGLLGYASKEARDDCKPVFRFCKGADHVYTQDETEKNAAVEAGAVDEGIAFYAHAAE